MEIHVCPLKYPKYLYLLQSDPLFGPGTDKRKKGEIPVGLRTQGLFGQSRTIWTTHFCVTRKGGILESFQTQ